MMEWPFYERERLYVSYDYQSRPRLYLDTLGIDTKMSLLNMNNVQSWRRFSWKSCRLQLVTLDD